VARTSRLMLTAGVVGVLVAGSAGAQSTGGEGWRQFRGPNATGIATVTKAPPVDFGPGRNMRWKTDLPPGHSSPVLEGDRLFVTAFDSARERLLVLALDRRTGAERWRRDITYERLGSSHAVSTPVTATPVVDGERVYAYFVQAGLFAWDLDGNPIWSLPIPFEQVRFGSGTSPILAGDRLILNRDSAVDPFIMAVDTRSGDVLWRVAREIPPGPAVPFASYSTPVLAGDQVVVHGMGTITSYDIATGARRWWVNASSTGTSTPALAGQMLYVATWSPFGEDDQLPALPDFATVLRDHDRDGSGTISQAELEAARITIARRPEVPDVPGATFSVPFGMTDADKSGDLTAGEWSALLATVRRLTVNHGLLAVRSGGEGDVTTSHVLWREDRSLSEVPSPLFYEGRIYYVRNGGILTCLDAATGAVKYRTRLGAPGPYYSSPIAAGGRLYVGSGEGLLVAFAPGDTLTVLARNDLGEPLFATPAVSEDGTMYVRTPTALYAFGE
jgi:outer membrane protein assembly factor BamB